MKLFIWHGDGVLEDWSSGQITCIAKDLPTALQIIDEEMDTKAILSQEKNQRK